MVRATDAAVSAALARNVDPSVASVDAADIDVDIDSLLISQQDLRDTHRIGPMVAFVRAGGRWTTDGSGPRPPGLSAAPAKPNTPAKPDLPITINRFEDGRLLLHDGHHRATATLLAGRRRLAAGEFVLWHFPYRDYREANLANGWVTPFDPPTECRLADFFAFRDEALAAARVDAAAALALIHSGRHRYARRRSRHGVRELFADVPPAAVPA